MSRTFSALQLQRLVARMSWYAAALCGAAIRAGLGAGALAVPGDLAARHVGVLGARMLARGEGVTAGEVVPHYVRRAEAEVRRTGERFESAPKVR